MKKIKKKHIIIISILVVFILVFFYFNPLFVYVPDCEKGEVICVEYIEDDDGNFSEKTHNVTMSTEDTKIIKEIFNKPRVLYYDTPSCGFAGHYLRLGNQEFHPACDTCNTILYKNKYFNISEKEIDTIIEIMEKYGANFPCV